VLDNCRQCTGADRQKLTRLTFYDPLVLEQLGFSMNNLDLERLRIEIPDPAGTTTLGEALLIVSLAPLKTRKEVRQRFEDRIVGRLAALPFSTSLDTCAWSSDSKSVSEGICPPDVVRPKQEGPYLLPLTWHALGIWEQDSSPGLTSTQLEITRALRSTYESCVLSKLSERLIAYSSELSNLNSQLNQIRRQLAELQDKAVEHLNRPENNQLHELSRRNDPLQPNTERTRLVLRGLSAADQDTYRELYSQSSSLKARLQTIERQSVSFLAGLQSEGHNVEDLLPILSDSSLSPDVKRELVEIQLSRAISAATPREAAADEMLKEMIIAIEDDLDRLFMQPMIRSLRKRLTSETNVRVGILQRESMLATNRGKARVDPRASAQLAVGEEEDILAGVQQLAQLYGAVQSGGALAALGALEQHPRETQPEIYALTTGNRFEVTPIFDPSGQALRFKFDFVGASKLQEPNGTTDPQFPRIERHTVNTEVQLSNLETREISRFESDARLGLPTRYWGGFPILKDIPYVRPWVPLVGWFIRKAGSNAVAQQSVIFGQTTIYPSIPTMVSLLEDSGCGSGVTPKQDEAKPPTAQPGDSQPAPNPR
jgi:hypothetical protein